MYIYCPFLPLQYQTYVKEGTVNNKISCCQRIASRSFVFEEYFTNTSFQHSCKIGKNREQ